MRRLMRGVGNSRGAHRAPCRDQHRPEQSYTPPEGRSMYLTNPSTSPDNQMGPRGGLAHRLNLSRPDAVNWLRLLGFGFRILLTPGTGWLLEGGVRAGVRVPSLLVDDDPVEWLLSRGLADQLDSDQVVVAITAAGLCYLESLNDALVEQLLTMEQRAPSEVAANLANFVRWKYPRLDLYARTYLVAGLILSRFLGEEWVRVNFAKPRKRQDFFKVKGALQDERDMHYVRKVQLADMLENLQQVPCFDAVLKQLRESSVESAYAELEVGKLLFFARVPFRFNHRVNEAGKDYDVVLHVGAHEVCGETKCKLEVTELRDTTISNTWRRIRDQLPHDKPGMLFVKIPQVWTDGSSRNELKGMLHAAAEDLFNLTRVVSVVFFASRILPVPCEETLTQIAHVEEIVNPNHKFDKSQSWTILEEDIPAYPAAWMNLFKLCA